MAFNTGMNQIKLVIEKHSDGYLAYPLGLNGLVVGEGDTYEEALKDGKSATKFHIATFGKTAGFYGSYQAEFTFVPDVSE